MGAGTSRQAWRERRRRTGRYTQRGAGTAASGDAQDDVELEDWAAADAAKEEAAAESGNRAGGPPQRPLRAASWENQFQTGLGVDAKEFIRLRKESLWMPGVAEGAGMANLGNTCFMNAAVQCLSHTAPLTDFFVGTSMWRRDLNRRNPLGTGGALALEYADLLAKMFDVRVKAVAPRKFKKMLADFAPQFSGFRQHDCQELLAFLLDGLHEDLNRVVDKPYLPAPESAGRPDEVVAAEQWKLHLLRNKSIIVDLMQGQLRSCLTCKVCGHASVTFDPFMYLSLPVPQPAATDLGARISGGAPVPPRSREPSGATSSAADVPSSGPGAGAAALDEEAERPSLAALLEQFLQPEELTGAEQWRCPRCKAHVDAVKKLDLWKLPPVLIVHLKRFRYSRSGVRTHKLGVNVDFPLKDLRLDGIAAGAQRDRPHYDLYAVSRHLGGSAGGHYQALTRARDDGRQWFMFDDARRAPVPADRVQDANAYLLFYQRREMSEDGYRRQSVSNPRNWPHHLPDAELARIGKLGPGGK